MSCYIGERACLVSTAKATMQDHAKSEMWRSAMPKESYLIITNIHTKMITSQIPINVRNSIAVCSKFLSHTLNSQMCAKIVSTSLNFGVLATSYIWDPTKISMVTTANNAVPCKDVSFPVMNSILTFLSSL